MTAIRYCRTATREMESASTTTLDNLIGFIKTNYTNMRYNYALFAKIFNTCIQANSELSSVIAQGNTRKVSDRFKLMSNIFFIATLKATHNFTIINCKIVPKILSTLDKLLSCKESDFSLEREAETKIKLLISNSDTIPCSEVVKHIGTDNVSCTSIHSTNYNKSDHAQSNQERTSVVTSQYIAPKNTQAKKKGRVTFSTSTANHYPIIFWKYQRRTLVALHGSQAQSTEYESMGHRFLRNRQQH